MKAGPATRRYRPVVLLENWLRNEAAHMVKHLVDRYDDARIDGRNHLTLTKRCAVAKANR